MGILERGRYYQLSTSLCFQAGTVMEPCNDLRRRPVGNVAAWLGVHAPSPNSILVQSSLNLRCLLSPRFATLHSNTRVASILHRNMAPMRSTAFFIVTWLLSVLLVVQTNAALAEPKLSYVLKSAKLALSTVDGSSRLSNEFVTHTDYSQNAAPFDLAKPTQLENDDVIRLTFSLAVEEASGKKVGKKDGPALGKEHVPHQAFVVLAADNEGATSQAWPVAVKPSTGKVSWNLVSIASWSRLLCIA